MIVRATAIPLAYYPYSSTSRIVHWLTRNHGKISTLLKGALRPKSPFLGEYELFSTSELLYFTRRTETLYAGKECSMLHRRDSFRTDWRAMQAASYITALINKTTPEEAPQPELFEFYEELLDQSIVYGHDAAFTLWTELRFSDFHGHAPNLEQCVLCSSIKNMRFCASAGGVVCASCAREKKLAILPCPPDILAILRAWQKLDHPGTVSNTRLSGQQLTALSAITGTFMRYHFHMPPACRNAALLGAHGQSI